MCEAMKLDRRVTHTICVVRDDEHAPFTVLSPCGICKERLRYWGDDVMCAVSDNNQGEHPLFVPLRDLQPHHWTQVYPPAELEHYER